MTKILERNGVFIGSPSALNNTNDSLPFTYDFQRGLLPKFWKWTEGCYPQKETINAILSQCYRKHLAGYKGGPWAIKTCAGMFCHAMYRMVFPEAKYIYMVRDGRDVVTSGDGHFHLTNPSSREKDWDYFKIITCGLTGFSDLPWHIQKNLQTGPKEDDRIMKNRFLIQARSWVEHIRMMERLRRDNRLSTQVYTIRYEELCEYPTTTVGKLLDWLEIPYKNKEFGKKVAHMKSIHKDNKLTRDVRDMLEPELKRLKYA